MPTGSLEPVTLQSQVLHSTTAIITLYHMMFNDGTTVIQWISSFHE